MLNAARVAAILPAHNEAESLGMVLRAMPDWIWRVIVVDNASTDETAKIAADQGALVVHEPERGYGAACLAGVGAAHGAEIYLFLDADGSDLPAEAAILVEPIAQGEADLVIGSRALGQIEPGALTPPQAFGNWLAARLMHWIWGRHVTDLGPFRAISRAAYDRLGMHDRDFGWTVEMQARAFRRRLRVLEQPVTRRRRFAGASKITGTVKGVLRAGAKILFVIAREWLAEIADRRAGRTIPQAPRGGAA